MAIIVRRTPSKAYEDIMSDLASIKGYCEEAVTRYSSTTSTKDILTTQEYLIAKRDVLAQRASTRGIAAYARAQEDNPAYDIAGEWVVLRTALQSAIDFVEANFPRTTFLTFDPVTDKPTYQTIPPGQLGGLRTALNSIIASIDTTELS